MTALDDLLNSPKQAAACALAAIALLAGCSAPQPVPGAPEIQLRPSHEATVATLRDGQRIVHIVYGQTIVATIVLPALPVEKP